MRSSSRNQSSSRGANRAPASGAPRNKEISLDDLLGDTMPSKVTSKKILHSAAETGSRSNVASSSFSKSTQLGKSKPVRATAPARDSSEKKF